MIHPLPWVGLTAKSDAHPPETEVCDLAPMEAHIRAGKRFDEARIGQREGLEVSDEWARSLVECRGHSVAFGVDVRACSHIWRLGYLLSPHSGWRT